jgi:nucleoid-associated protein YgaU
VSLHVYRDGSARPGIARLPVIHAVPELGSPNLVFDGQTVVRGFPYQAATPYLSVKPGVHRYAAKKPGDGTLLKGTVNLEAGKAYTGLVVGSRGERVRVVAAIDDDGTGSKPRSTRRSTRRARSTKTSNRSARSTYTVRPGDSLWMIAKHGLRTGASNAAIWGRVVEIWNKNEIRISTGDPDLIYPGTRLRLP